MIGALYRRKKARHRGSLVSSRISDTRAYETNFVIYTVNHTPFYLLHIIAIYYSDNG